MSENSKIEWTEATWNPIAGCTWASSGCDHCYAAAMTRRLEAMGRENYTGLTTNKHFNGNVRMLPAQLVAPLQRKKPTMYFVNSMSDLFHKDVPFDFIDEVFAVMNATQFTLPISERSKRWHTYQILTKRPERAFEYLESRRATHFTSGEHPIFSAGRSEGGVLRNQGLELMNAGAVLQWPLPNVWIGTSCEDQQRADERMPWLRKCRDLAAVLFVSAEPLLAPLDFSRWMSGLDISRDEQGNDAGSASGGSDIDWLIVGGESGPHARPMHPDWVRSIRDQCQDAGVPFFFKQWGEFSIHQAISSPRSMVFSPPIPLAHFSKLPMGKFIGSEYQLINRHDSVQSAFATGEYFAFRVRKKAAGRLLDGREWNEFPRIDAKVST